MNPIKDLELYLKKNNIDAFAKALGYKSGATVNAWLKRKEIPKWMEEPVRVFLKAQGK